MSQSWWRTDQYDRDEHVPQDFTDLAGPRGVALVRAWPSGITDPGWGLIGANGAEGFCPRYARREFDSRRVLPGFDKGRWNYAFVMRSMQLVCIDIDGKNGGLDHAKRLGMLPPTLAETSKSGNGYHLFYSYEEEWDSNCGFGQLSDRIAIEQGVDIRATGCVYRHPQQRWNRRSTAALPAHLRDRLLHREQKVAANVSRIQTVLADADPTEVLMMHHEILQDLAKPIPAGRRNTTLFAIGQQMRLADIEAWDEKLSVRAEEVGLDPDEVVKLVANIERYAGATP